MAKKEILKDDSAEQKILDAARKLFTERGYDAVKTRDIALEAGINMALLHYYFRSKEKLFEMIMMEAIQQFLSGIKDMINDKSTSLEEKIDAFVDQYIDMLISHPNLPFFIFSGIRSNPELFASKMKVKEMLPNSYFIKQFQEMMVAQKKKVHPMHFLMNIIGMTVFPFIGAPLLQQVGNINQAEFAALMQQRKKMIPGWIKAMML